MTSAFIGGQRFFCLSSFGIAAEHAEEVGCLAQVIERVDGDRGTDGGEEVKIEEVFPRLAAERARFDLHQVEIAQGEGAECAEECAGDIASAEDQRGLPLRVGGHAERVAASVVGSAQEKEAGKILPVAFNGAA